MTNTHRVTDPKPVATREEFFKLFAESVHKQLNAYLDRPTTHGIVCYENITFGSSHFGERSAMIYGDGCTYTTLEECLDGHLGELPSTFKYPVYYYVKPGVDTKPAAS